MHSSRSKIIIWTKIKEKKNARSTWKISKFLLSHYLSLEMFQNSTKGRVKRNGSYAPFWKGQGSLWVQKDVKYVTKWKVGEVGVSGKERAGL